MSLLYDSDWKSQCSPSSISKIVNSVASSEHQLDASRYGEPEAQSHYTEHTAVASTVKCGDPNPNGKSVFGLQKQSANVRRKPGLNTPTGQFPLHVYKPAANGEPVSNGEFQGQYASVRRTSCLRSPTATQFPVHEYKRPVNDLNPVTSFIEWQRMRSSNDLIQGETMKIEDDTGGKGEDGCQWVLVDQQPEQHHLGESLRIENIEKFDKAEFMKRWAFDQQKRREVVRQAYMMAPAKPKVEDADS